MPTVEARRDALEQFVADFERGAYWDAHEHLEAPWRDERLDLWQALVQLAAVFVLVGSGRSDGARRVLGRARVKVEGLPALVHGVDVAWVRGRMDALDGRLAAGVSEVEALAPLFEGVNSHLGVGE